MIASQLATRHSFTPSAFREGPLPLHPILAPRSRHRLTPQTWPLPLHCVMRIVEITGCSMNLDRLNRITVETGKCGGRPCIRGLRIRVTDVLELLAAGASYEEVLADYPYLEREDILAALDYAAHQTDHVVLPAS
jgi:uncharacterized protein (DUF433 family)